MVALSNLKEGYRQEYARELAKYWGLMARAAELQERRVDAMAFYTNALLSRLESQQRPETGVKDELAENAQQLWAKLGGTREGWNLWYGQHADSLAKEAAVAWEPANEPLPAFELADINGKVWTLASLKGKVNFLNFWASW